jgi:hypothetical protein
MGIPAHPLIEPEGQPGDHVVLQEEGEHKRWNAADDADGCHQPVVDAELRTELGHRHRDGLGVRGSEDQRHQELVPRR